MKKILSILCITALMAMCLFSLASCGDTPNSDPALASAALTGAGYTVVDGASSATRYGFSGLVSSIHAVKGFESVTVFYFANEESAEIAYDLMKRTEEENEKEYEKNGISLPDLELEMDYCDNVVWIGTPEAISASK